MSSKLSIDIEVAIEQNLGWKIAENTRAVKANSPHVIAIGEDKLLVTCVEEDRPYVEAMAEMVGVKPDNVKYIIPARGARPAAGKGFGDKVWRENSEHGGIELSFEKRPDDGIRATLKTLGFRWSRMSGVWYIPTKKMGDGVAQFLADNGFTKVEGV